MRPLLAALVALPVALGGCNRPGAARGSPANGSTSAASPPEEDATPSVRCVPDPSFPAVFDVPEASAAAEVEITKGVRELLVVSDSDRKGAALAYGIPDGPARKLTLPLDPRMSDDVEGLAWRGGHLYALVSTGYVERFTPDPKRSAGLARDGDSYALGPPPYVATDLKESNGQPPDFEGLCLRPPSLGSRCAGYAASRAYGWLACLVFHGDRLEVDPLKPRLALHVKKHSLSDCAFGAEGGPAENDLLVTTNIRGGSTVYRVDEGTGALSPIDVPGTANNEAIAVDRDGRLYQLMDANGAESPGVRATCTGW